MQPVKGGASTCPGTDPRHRAQAPPKLPASDGSYGAEVLEYGSRLDDTRLSIMKHANDRGRCGAVHGAAGRSALWRSWRDTLVQYTL